MSITRYPPNTVFLGGTRTQVNDLAASEAIMPGHLIERFNAAGVWRWKKHASAGVGGAAAVATDQAMLNKGVADAYAANDLVEASILHKGATAWMIIPSGQAVTFGMKLESNGDGRLKPGAAGVPMFVALETKAATTGDAWVRVEAL